MKNQVVMGNRSNAKRKLGLPQAIFIVMTSVVTNVYADPEEEQSQSAETVETTEESVIDLIIQMLIPGGTHQPPP